MATKKTRKNAKPSKRVEALEAVSAWKNFAYSALIALEQSAGDLSAELGRANSPLRDSVPRSAVREFISNIGSAITDLMNLNLEPLVKISVPDPLCTLYPRETRDFSRT